MDNRYEYVFKRLESTNMHQLPLKGTFNFYQIALFPINGVYEIRRSTFDGIGDIIKVKKMYTNKKNLKKIISLLKDKKYHTYATYNLNNIPLPSKSYFDTLTSELLNQPI